MSDEVGFDGEVVAALERVYRTPSMAERRRRVRDALALEPGERVLPVGTGPGFESRGLAEDVGPDGRVHGVDTAEPMLAAARERCADQPRVTFERDDAADLDVEDGAFDAHCPHPRLARTLEPRLERANFEGIDRDAYVHFETELSEDSTGAALLPPIEAFVTRQGGVDEAEAEAWVEYVHERGEAGEYFFSFVQYLFVIEKPSAGD